MHSNLQHGWNGKGFWGVERLFSVKWFQIRFPSPGYCSELQFLLGESVLGGENCSVTPAEVGLRRRGLYPQSCGVCPVSLSGGFWDAAHGLEHLTASFVCVCVLFFCYCHCSLSQNKYLMLWLSLHLIKMYRICAVNSNETNKTRAPSLEGIRCEWKMSLQTKKFCSKQGLQREVSPVMTSIKYTNGTFSTILNMAFSVLYTQSKWFDHRA